VIPIKELNSTLHCALRVDGMATGCDLWDGWKETIK
jgi:hypothetical protein